MSSTESSVSMRMTQTESSLVVQTPAKLNLSLKVLGRRDDGFHSLETLMISVRLYDTLSFEPCTTPDISLTTHRVGRGAASIPTGPENLVVRAAELLRSTTRTEAGVRIHLTKRIPSEAGMGGGSSDAAATLVGLNRLWNLNLPTAKLHEIASQLGSDLNFFIDSPTAAVCTGRGEKISPMAVSRVLDFVVVQPPSGLSTAVVFKHWGTVAEAAVPGSEELARACRQGQLQLIGRGVFNSLETPARDLNSDIDGMLKMLEQFQLVAWGMTGSGSACFGLCRSRRHAERIVSRIKSRGIQRAWAVRSGV